MNYSFDRLCKDLYEANKYVDIDTYNDRKYKAIKKVRDLENVDYEANKLYDYGRDKFDYGNPIGETYKSIGRSLNVESGELEAARNIASWYENYSFEWIQAKRYDEERNGGGRRGYEEQASSLPDDLWERQKKQNQHYKEREQYYNDKEKFYNKGGLWIIGGILLSGIIGGYVFASHVAIGDKTVIITITTIAAGMVCFGTSYGMSDFGDSDDAFAACGWGCGGLIGGLICAFIIVTKLPHIIIGIIDGALIGGSIGSIILRIVGNTRRF